MSTPDSYQHTYNLPAGQKPGASVCVVVSTNGVVHVSWTTNTEPMWASMMLAEGIKVLIQVLLQNKKPDEKLVVPVSNVSLPPFPGPSGTG